MAFSIKKWLTNDEPDVFSNKNVSNSFYEYLTKRISTIDKIQYVYDPVRNFCVNSDFTVILSH